MRKFFIIIEKLATLSQQLTYGHYVELLPIENLNEVIYYIKIIEEQNLSIRQLRLKIKSNEYKRLPDETKQKLINKQHSNVVDFVKNPIKISNTKNYKIATEKMLKKIILKNIENFLEELGSGFSFIKSEYKINVDNTYNYMDCKW